MEARHYQQLTGTFDTHVNYLGAIPYALGLAAEAGEVANEFERSTRKDYNLDWDKVRAELGDVLWHLAGIANTFGWSLEEIMDENIKKLEERYDREGIADRDDR